MPKIAYKIQDKQQLFPFYKRIERTLCNSNGQSFLTEDLKNLSSIVKSKKEVERIKNQVGVWASMTDANHVGEEQIKTLKRKNPILVERLQPFLYHNVLYKLLQKVKSMKYNGDLKQQWIYKFVDPQSDFYCEQFAKDVAKVNPTYCLNTNIDYQKKIILTYIKESKMIMNYPNIHGDQKAKERMSKKYTGANWILGKGIYENVIKYIGDSNSKFFDPRMFELALSYIGYKVDGKKPDESMKKCIIRQLEKGHYIDSPGWHLFTQKQHLWLDYWWNLYTKEDSAFYDKKFTTQCRQKYPGQFSMYSIKYDSTTLRHNDKIKDEYLLNLQKLGPKHNYTGMGPHMSDKIFAEKVAQLKKKLSWSISKPFIEKKQVKLQKILDAIGPDTNFLNIAKNIIPDTSDTFHSGLLRYINPNNSYYDKNFTEKCKQKDPVLITEMQKEFVKRNPFRRRFERLYKEKKYNVMPPKYFLVKPSWPIIHLIDQANALSKYSNKTAPSMFAEVRKDKFDRDTIRRTYEKKYGKKCPYKGNNFNSFKSKAAMPWTRNLNHNFDFMVFEKHKDLKKEAYIVGLDLNKFWYVPKGKHAGSIIFKADCKSDEKSITAHLEKIISQKQIQVT